MSYIRKYDCVNQLFGPSKVQNTNFFCGRFRLWVVFSVTICRNFCSHKGLFGFKWRWARSVSIICGHGSFVRNVNENLLLTSWWEFDDMAIKDILWCKCRDFLKEILACFMIFFRVFFCLNNMLQIKFSSLNVVSHNDSVIFIFRVFFVLIWCCYGHDCEGGFNTASFADEYKIIIIN